MLLKDFLLELNVGRTGVLEDRLLGSRVVLRTVDDGSETLLILRNLGVHRRLVVE